MFTYYSTFENLSRHHGGWRIARIPTGITTKRDLLAALAEALSFPSYFGGNYDALWDCLCALDGVSEYRVLLAHEDLPDLPEEELRVYIEILYEALIFWETHYDEHIVTIAFPETARNGIAALTDG